MNSDSLESSIQNLLSVLYPPFEATAPTLLSQLFQVIDSRYRGDALRCLLDFLVPVKHILDSVQQAACAQYSDVLFLCEGWPLCLRDQVVVHLAPINPLILQPGDFYLQVAPFCDQSARIVVCSLLEEEGLEVEVVEENPIPETSYPCIFSCDWLEEINQGRHGTPLSRCLLATEQGVVRLPWERIAVPDFVDVALCAGSSMASAPPSYPPLPPIPPPLPHFPKSSSSNYLFLFLLQKNQHQKTILLPFLILIYHLLLIHLPTLWRPEYVQRGTALLCHSAWWILKLRLPHSWSKLKNLKLSLSLLAGCPLIHGTAALLGQIQKQALFQVPALLQGQIQLRAKVKKRL
ncbi:uncharacterized protein KIAA1755-like [Eleginops maclovinus]|uniref:uncharacterized protein KIAA1755-like n=1 Tax=Eleginops maclovinus TaxID=56733 RepID=UPI003080C9A1